MNYIGYTSRDLQDFAKCLTDEEKNKCEYTIRLIGDCLDKANSGVEIKVTDRFKNYERLNEALLFESSHVIDKDEFRLFLQGSYANDTNIKTESDVDIALICDTRKYRIYKDGNKTNIIKPNDSSIAPFNMDEFKKKLLGILKDKFGSSNVTMGKKSIKIAGDKDRKNVDLVPCFRVEMYNGSNADSAEFYTDGICIIGPGGKEIFNYPRIHIEKGKSKNGDTNQMYKKVVRVIKSIHSDRIGKSKNPSDKARLESIKSFVLECLVYTYPTEKFITDNLSKTVRKVVDYLALEADYRTMKEINGINPLFNEDRPSADYKWFFNQLSLYLDIIL